MVPEKKYFQESKVKDFREELGLTQQQLADEVGVSRQTINYLEKGDYNPSLTLSFKLTEIFQKTLEKYYGSTLNWFFEQWIEGFDIPGINFNHKIKEISDKEHKIFIIIEQICKKSFIIGLLFEINFEDNIEYKKIMLSKKITRFTLVYKKKPVKVIFDRDNYILNR